MGHLTATGNTVDEAQDRVLGARDALLILRNRNTESFHGLVPPQGYGASVNVCTVWPGRNGVGSPLTQASCELA